MSVHLHIFTGKELLVVKPKEISYFENITPSHRVIGIYIKGFGKKRKALS